MIEKSNIFESHRAELIKLWFLIHSLDEKELGKDYLLEKIAFAIVGIPITLHKNLEDLYLEERKLEKI